MSETTPSEIQVYASFPRAVTLGTNFYLNPSNWRWVHCLTLPVETLSTLQLLSQKPYKWLRYAIGVVVGAEGDLSPTSDSDSLGEVVDYDARLPTEGSTVLYYHTSDEEKQRMFPVDPDTGGRTHTTPSLATTRRIHFHDEVAQRDGSRCVMVGIGPLGCDTVHLLAHDKGGAYITMYTRCRSRDPNRGDIVQEIDSVRNGLFLNKITRAMLGTDVVFLRTPNFAMTTTDVDPAAPPTERRHTAHPFQLGVPFLLGSPFTPDATPSSTTLQVSDTPEWPPAILFGTVYASAVLDHFGTQALKDDVATTWKDTFYPGGNVPVPHADYMDKHAREDSRQRAQARYDEAHRGPDMFDRLMAIPYI